MTAVSTKERPFAICSVNDYQIAAKAKLPRAIYEYLASGTDDEQTLFENRAGFKGWFLRPRVLRPVGQLRTSTVIRFPNCGTCVTMSMPVFVSPAGLHAICDPPNGEIATARACGAAGIPFALSQHSTRTIEQVAQAAPSTIKFYQAYILKDRDRTLRLVQRALDAGYQGVFLTVDSVRFGYREADARNGFDALPPPHRLVNYDHDVNAQSMLPESNTSLEKIYNSRKAKSWDQNSEQMFDQETSWEDVRWLKSHCRGLPLIIKGIMTAEDAILAAQAGVDGIMVSNHGGRQLDGALGAIDVLPEVVAAVRGTGIPVFLDGGVRRGTDILKALAMGASLVGLGKPVFFALAVGGESAVGDMLRILQRELGAAMALTGCRSVVSIGPELVTRHPNNGHGAMFVRSSL